MITFVKITIRIVVYIIFSISPKKFVISTRCLKQFLGRAIGPTKILFQSVQPFPRKKQKTRGSIYNQKNSHYLRKLNLINSKQDIFKNLEHSIFSFGFAGLF